MEGIKWYGGSSIIPVFPSIAIIALQCRGMPYRRGGHTTASSIAALGGESNYVDEPRRRRPPPVRSLILESHLLDHHSICIPPLSASLLRFLHADACTYLPPRSCPHSIPLASLLRMVLSRRDRFSTRYALPAQLASCCGERSMVLSTFPHQSFPPHHHRALTRPHSIRRRPTSVQSIHFHRLESALLVVA